MRSKKRCFYAVLSILCVPCGGAVAGASVVIDSETMKMVSSNVDACPAAYVRFVTEAAAIVAVCDMPPAVKLAAVPPPPPTWSIEPGKEIRLALQAWIPTGWTLAWDAGTKPLAAVGYSYTGESMAAIADLFDRRNVWADAPLIACSFPKQKILQVRETGVCGTP